MTDDDGLRRWREALATHRRAQRNKRGERRDPWARAQKARLVLPPPAHREQHDDDEHEK